MDALTVHGWMHGRSFEFSLRGTVRAPIIGLAVVAAIMRWMVGP